MKILKGSLTETRYAWPTIDLNNSEDRHMQVISEKTYKTDQVTYMSDKLGLHRISNPDKENYAVSLHCKSTMGRHLVCKLTANSVYPTQRSSLWLQCVQ